MYSYLNRHRIRKSFQNKQKISERERHEKVDSLSDSIFSNYHTNRTGQPRRSARSIQKTTTDETP